MLVLFGRVKLHTYPICRCILYALGPVAHRKGRDEREKREHKIYKNREIKHIWQKGLRALFCLDVSFTALSRHLQRRHD